MEIIKDHLPFTLVPFAFFLFVLLASCSTHTSIDVRQSGSGITEKLSQTSTSTRTPAYTPTLTGTPSIFRVKSTRTPDPDQSRAISHLIDATFTPTATATPLPTVTPTAPIMLLARHDIASGSAIPIQTTPISEQNLSRLTRVAQWGQGSITRIIASPDGQHLIAGSPYGISIYATSDLQHGKRWLPFEAPVFFDDLAISQDGGYLRLKYSTNGPNQKTDYKIYRLVDGKQVDKKESITWESDQRDILDDDTGFSLTSPDHYLRVEHSVQYITEPEYKEIVTGTISLYSGASTSSVTLKDEPMYVEYWDAHTPDGCDLRTFSYCGNVYDPRLMTPYRASFSPSGHALAVLYRASEYYYSQQFSLLRIYSTSDGTVLGAFGSFDQPVQDFTYLPGSDHLVVAFVSGSIQVWNASLSKLDQQVWDFNPPVMEFVSSVDGRYLLAQSPDSVLVIRAQDGAVLSRYRATALSLSPVENLLALGDNNGNIRVENLDTQKTVSRMVGHTATVYALTFSPDGRTLVSSSEDCTVRSWDTFSGQALHYFEDVRVNAIGEQGTESRIFVYYMRFIPDSSQMVGFGSWGTVASWDIQSGASSYSVVSEPLEYYHGLNTLNPHFPSSFWVIPEKSRFYVAGAGYDLDTGQAAEEFTSPARLPAECGLYGPKSVDGRLLFTAGYDQLAGQMCVLDATDYHLLYRLPLSPDEGQGGVIVSPISMSSDGSRLFVVSEDGPISVYQIQP